MWETEVTSPYIVMAQSGSLTSRNKGSRVQRKVITEEAGLMSRSKVP